MAIKRQYKLFTNLGLLIACIGFAYCSLLVGAVATSHSDILAALVPKKLPQTWLSELSNWFGAADVTQGQLVIEKIRLPRVLLALLVGSSLGLCGAASQGLFRNPLADPSLIGVSAGASVGATLFIFLGSLGGTFFELSFSSQSGLPLVSLGAFIFALLTVYFVYQLASSGQQNHYGTSVTTMLLAGVAITSLAGSITSLLSYLSDNTALRKMSLWQMGSLDGASPTHIILMTLALAVTYIGLTRQHQALNALLLGESEARHLGINVKQIKLKIITFIAIGVGVAFATAGAIGFIGLVIPHIMRLIIGPDHRYLLSASMFSGALLLLIADTIGRTIIAPAEIPVGIITAIIGVPFFISLLRKRHLYAM